LSELSNEDVSSKLLVLILWIRVLIWWWTSAEDIGSGVLVIQVVGEQVVKLGFDDALNHFSDMVSLLGNDFNNNFHDLRDHRWESLESLVDDLLSIHLQLLISILN